ncbi:GntR family transcriptional regulator [Microbacterium algeriense]|uniref:GntR family transcriptional regulator n=1 Tax=Microbacterium algeriense TaxID=2615184 RepID=UPI0022E92259|nr:GntR family transcriptional regulator [Microbacterium algeriense]
MTAPVPRRVTEMERRNLRDRVYDLILEMLLDGDVEPGARLSIDTLARQLDVSPTPVREAMVQLERTELVTREALRGYRVAPPLGPDQLDELFAARLMLEVEAARLATPHAADLLADLRAAHDRHQDWAQRIAASMRSGTASVRDMQEYFAADADFHEVILRAAGNRYIMSMHADLGALTHRMRQAVLRGANDVEEAHAEHAAIIDAFDSDDPEAPAAAMRAHIEGVRDRSWREADGDPLR